MVHIVDMTLPSHQAAFPTEILSLCELFTPSPFFHPNLSISTYGDGSTTSGETVYDDVSIGGMVARECVSTLPNPPYC